MAAPVIYKLPCVGLSPDDSVPSVSALHPRDDGNVQCEPLSLPVAAGHEQDAGWLLLHDAH